MPSHCSTSRSVLFSVALALPVAGGCAKAPPPDFGVLKPAPVMTRATEEQAANEDGSPLADFAWECDAYGAYIDALRGEP